MNRIIVDFLWWPKTIQGEWRWLTRNAWEEQADIYVNADTGQYEKEWEPVRWIDNTDLFPAHMPVV